jgi:hypothetical protein
MKADNDRFPGFDIPRQNWSKLPHAMIEQLPNVTSLAEMKVILYILRHTWGYQEFNQAKRITLDEFQNGRKRKDGNRIDAGVGMSANAIRDGLRRAVADGFILQTSDGRDEGRSSHEYELRIRVQELNPTPSEVEPQAATFEPQSAEVEPRSEKDTIEKKPKKETKETGVSSPSPIITCEIHNTPMKLRQSGSASWYSHKLSDGTWCQGKEGKKRARRSHTDYRSYEGWLPDRVARESPPPQTPDQILWAQIQTELQLGMTQATYDTWLRNTTAQRIDGALTITVANEYAQDWLEHRLRVVGEGLQVIFAIADGAH